LRDFTRYEPKEKKEEEEERKKDRDGSADKFREEIFGMISQLLLSSRDDDTGRLIEGY
jgi:hypothetical protein